MNKLAKHTKYLFMQDGATADTAKLTLEILKDKEQQFYHWPPNNPDLSQVDFQIWGLLEQNLYQGRRKIDLDSLKETITEEWVKQNSAKKSLIDVSTHLNLGFAM